MLCFRIELRKGSMYAPGPMLVVLALSMRRMRSLLPLSAVPSPKENQQTALARHCAKFIQASGTVPSRDRRMYFRKNIAVCYLLKICLFAYLFSARRVSVSITQWKRRTSFIVGLGY